MASNINRLLFEGYVNINRYNTINPFSDKFIGSNTESESGKNVGASNGYNAGDEGSTDSDSSPGNETWIKKGPPTNFKTRKNARNALINSKLVELEQKQTNRKAKQLKQMYNNLHSARIQSVQQTRKLKPAPSFLNRILSKKRGGRYRSKFTKKAGRRRGSKI
jgi:hypothetical protein